jgi:hypothetical protein
MRYGVGRVDAEERTSAASLKEQPWTFSSTNIKIVS